LQILNKNVLICVRNLWNHGFIKLVHHLLIITFISHNLNTNNTEKRLWNLEIRIKILISCIEKKNMKTKSNCIATQIAHSTTNSFATPNSINNHRISHHQQDFNENRTKKNFPLTHQTTKQLSHLMSTHCS